MGSLIAKTRFQCTSFSMFHPPQRNTAETVDLRHVRNSPKHCETSVKHRRNISETAGRAHSETPETPFYKKGVRVSRPVSLSARRWEMPSTRLAHPASQANERDDGDVAWAAAAGGMVGRAHSAPISVDVLGGLCASAPWRALARRGGLPNDHRDRRRVDLDRGAMRPVKSAYLIRPKTNLRSRMNRWRSGHQRT